MLSLRRWLVPTLFLALALHDAPARAETAPRLTDRGRTMLAGSLGGFWSNNDRGPGLVVYPRWAVWLSPSALYFVRDRLALGGWAHYGYQRLTGAAFTRVESELGAGVQAAYELALAPRLGLLLVPQLGYLRHWRSLEEPPVFAGGAGRTQQQRSPLAQQQLTGTEDQLQLALSAPLLVHVTDSVAVGFGPYLRWDYYIQARDWDGGRYGHLRVGASTWIGGSF